MEPDSETIVLAQDPDMLNFRKELRPNFGNLVTSKSNIELLWFVEYDCADKLELSIRAKLSNYLLMDITFLQIRV